MAAAITTTATTLEGQALEIVREMQEAEALLVDVNNVQIDLDVEAGIVSLSVQLPVTLGGTGGALQIAAGTYLA